MLDKASNKFFNKRPPESFPPLKFKYDFIPKSFTNDTNDHLSETSITPTSRAIKEFPLVKACSDKTKNNFYHIMVDIEAISSIIT